MEHSSGVDLNRNSRQIRQTWVFSAPQHKLKTETREIRDVSI